MATMAEIYREVSGIVHGLDTELSGVIRYANKALKEVAGVVLLPELLETQTTINTVVGTAYASLPGDYMRNLHYCYSNTTYRKINIYDDVRILNRKFSRLDLAGNVVGVARKGSSLYYQRIPSSAETLRIHYYKNPTILTDGDSQPDCLPEFIVSPLLVNYIAKELFSRIELDVTESKGKTQYCEDRFRQAMGELSAYIGPESREPQYITDDVNLDGYL